MRNVTGIGKNYFFKIFEVEILAPPGGFVVYKEGVWGIRFPTPRGRWSGNKTPFHFVLLKILNFMAKFVISESTALLDSAARAIKAAKLAEKASQAAHPIESLKDGDVITILGGLARVSEFTNSEKEKVNFLCFDGTVEHVDGSTRPLTISLNTLMTPSWGNSEEIVKEGKRNFNALKLRFGHVKVSFTEVKGTTVPYIEDDIVLPALQVRTIFVPKYTGDGYEASSKEWAVVD